MDRSAFFAAVRARPFGGSLTQQQVDGMNVLLDQWRALYPDAPAHHIANNLAQVHRETGGRMVAIKETVMPSHRDINPSDAEVIRRLDVAFAAGRLPWVRTPYWRDGWFGRGHIQLTHRLNYERMGKRLGVDLVGNRDLALDPVISARVAIVGMVEGMFTGRKLADFTFPAALNEPPPRNPRRIVNGQDGSDAVVARMHRDFADALTAAEYRPGAAPAPVKPRDFPPLTVTPAPEPPAPVGFWAWLRSLFRA